MTVVVFAEAVAEASRFDADDRIRFRIERWASAQDLDGDDGFLDFARTSVECLFDDKSEKAAGASGVGEGGARQNPTQLRAHSRCFHKPFLSRGVSTALRCERWPFRFRHRVLEDVRLGQKGGVAKLSWRRAIVRAPVHTTREVFGRNASPLSVTSAADSVQEARRRAPSRGTNLACASVLSNASNC